jgi:large subunit ribosomal protein L5
MLKSKYKSIIPELKTELNLSSVSAVPKITKVVINVGVGSRVEKDAKYLSVVTEALQKITGQKVVVTNARKSIAGFKVREGSPVGVMVTIRGNRMYDFIERLISVGLARVRDFRGIKTSGFDGHGNYTLGIKEHTIFPEILFEDVEQTFGFEVTIATTAKDDASARLLLDKLGFPFAKKVEKNK